MKTFSLRSPVPLLLLLGWGSAAMACATPVESNTTKNSRGTTSASLAIDPNTPLGRVDHDAAWEGIDAHLEAPGIGVRTVEAVGDGLRVAFADGVVLDVRGDATSQTVTDADGNVVYRAQRSNEELVVVYKDHAAALDGSDRVGDLDAFLREESERDAHPASAVTEFARFLRSDRTKTPAMDPLVVVTQYVVTGIRAK